MTTDTTFLDFALRGRNAAWRYVASCILGTLLGTAIGVAVFLPLQLSGLAPPDLAQQLLDPSRPTVFFLATGVMFACLAAGFVLAARWVQAKRPRDLIGRWRWGQFGAAAAAWTLFLVLVTCVDALIAPGAFRVTASAQTLPLALVAVVGLAPQVFAEELIFRGLITQGLLAGLKRTGPAALVSGLIFGAVHIPNGLPQAASATMFGVIMAWVAIRTGGLGMSTGLHLANNLFGAVVVVSANDVFRGAPALFTQDTPQLLWFDVALTVAGLLAVAAIASRREKIRSGAAANTAPATDSKPAPDDGPGF